jgi:hypothetical protein
LRSNTSARISATDSNKKAAGSATPRLNAVSDLAVENDQSAALAETDFSDDDFEREDGLDSVDDDFDSVAGFDSLAGFEDESFDEAVAPLVAGFSAVDADSESVLLGVLFLA